MLERFLQNKRTQCSNVSLCSSLRLRLRLLFILCRYFNILMKRRLEMWSVALHLNSTIIILIITEDKHQTWRWNDLQCRHNVDHVTSSSGVWRLGGTGFGPDPAELPANQNGQRCRVRSYKAKANRLSVFTHTQKHIWAHITQVTLTTGLFYRLYFTLAAG